MAEHGLIFKKECQRRVARLLANENCFPDPISIRKKRLEIFGLNLVSQLLMKGNCLISNFLILMTFLKNTN